MRYLWIGRVPQTMISLTFDYSCTSVTQAYPRINFWKYSIDMPIIDEKVAFALQLARWNVVKCQNLTPKNLANFLWGFFSTPQTQKSK